MITKGSRIYISNKNDINHILECDVERIDADRRIHFEVVNGLWDGYFDPEQEIIYVKYTCEKYPSQIVYTGPRVRGNDYNERIDAVLQHIRENGIISDTTISAPGRTHTSGMQNVQLRTTSSNTGDAPPSKSGNVRGNLRTVNITDNSYLAIDKTHNEVRLFRRRNKKNVFVRSMSLDV